MEEDSRQYSLLDEPWIPVIRDGQQVLVGLREVLLNAATYERIDAGHPLKTVALYRLLLAILHRALQGPSGPEKAADWFKAGQFPPDQIEDYLSKYAHRFYLFGPEPFMQVAGLDPAKVGENFASHWTRLSAEDGSSNTTALFNVMGRGGEKKETLSPAEAALEMLMHQQFALGGLIKRLTTSEKAAPVATFSLFVVQGRNLLETLVLNLVSYRDDQTKDVPIWEEPQLDFATVKGFYDAERSFLPAGRVSRYAWPSRSILLLPQQKDGTIAISKIGYAAGKPLDRDANAQPYGSGTGLDPMMALRGGKQVFPFSFNREQLIWRDIQSLLPDPAPTVTQNKKGETIYPWQPPEVLNFAGEVLKLVAASQQTPVKRMGADLGQPLAKVKRSVPDVLLVSIFGQMTFQGKAFAMRQESYSMPRQVLENPALYHNYVRGALAQAGDVGSKLRFATELLAEALLARGDAPANKAAVRTLAGQFPSLPTYWAELETPFRTFLKDIATDAEGAQQRWQKAIVQQGRKAWKLAEEAAGTDGAGLRAVQLAKGPLLRELSKLDYQRVQKEQGS